MTNAWKIAAIALLFSACSTATPPRTAPPAESYFTTSDGTRLFVRTIRGGRGGTIIYLHGGPGGQIADGGYELGELLPERNWVMYDQRGGGRTDRMEGTITAAQHVEDLEQLRRHLGLERFAIVGLSWGSGLAAMYAAKYPQHVERIVFLSPMPVARIPFDDERSAAVAPYRGKNAARREELSQLLKTATGDEWKRLCRERFALGMYSAYVANPDSLRRARRCDHPERTLGPAQNDTIQSLGDWDYRPLLRTLTMPALVIEGAQSIVPLSSAREWAKSLPNGRLLLLENAGHANWLDQPEAFREAVAAFLDGRP
jgi:proline iminopeptidase